MRRYLAVVAVIQHEAKTRMHALVHRGVSSGWREQAQVRVSFAQQKKHHSLSALRRYSAMERYHTGRD